MKKTTTLATVVALTLMGSALCHAQDVSKDQKEFNRVDTDKNGSISLEEFKAKAKKPATAEERFNINDTDKNGSLSLEEWKNRKQSQKKAAAEAAQGAKATEGAEAAE